MPDLSYLIVHWGYWAIFAVVVLGNMGLPVPEETVLIVAGYLVLEGYLRLPIVLVVGAISAVAGDNVGYWFGRRYGQPAIDWLARWTGVEPKRMVSMRSFVVRYGPLGVFLGRFLPGLRFLAGPLAGATGVDFRRFFVANVLGAAIFVPYAVGLGYALGYGLGGFVAEMRQAERFVVGGMVIFCLALVGWRIAGVLLRRSVNPGRGHSG